MQRIGRTVALIALLGFAGVTTANAQDTAAWNPRTGDPWVDATLADVNLYGARYPDAFVDELARYYDAPRELVASLLMQKHWAPGDIYYACALAHVAGQPCRTVAGNWAAADHAAGWGAVAARQGVAPGSEQFRRLKHGLVRSYERWARPLQVDASLHAEFPQHPVAQPANADIPAAASPPANPTAPSSKASKRAGSTP